MSAVAFLCESQARAARPAGRGSLGFVCNWSVQVEADPAALGSEQVVGIARRAALLVGREPVPGGVERARIGGGIEERARRRAIVRSGRRGRQEIAVVGKGA